MKTYLTPKNILLALLVILMLGIFFRFFSLLSFTDSTMILEKGDPTIKMSKEETLSQKFVSKQDNLMKVEMMLKTPGVRPEDKVEMKIADGNCDKILRTGTLKPSFLASDNLFEFSFPKIPNSNGKTFCLMATFTEGKSKSIQFFTQENKAPVFPVANVTTGELDPAQALSIRTAHTNDHVWQDLGELSQRLSQYKPWFLKHYFIDATIFLFVVLSVGLVVILIIA